MAPAFKASCEGSTATEALGGAGDAAFSPARSSSPTDVSSENAQSETDPPQPDEDDAGMPSVLLNANIYDSDSDGDVDTALMRARITWDQELDERFKDIPEWRNRDRPKPWEELTEEERRRQKLIVYTAVGNKCIDWKPDEVRAEDVILPQDKEDLVDMWHGAAQVLRETEPPGSEGHRTGDAETNASRGKSDNANGNEPGTNEGDKKAEEKCPPTDGADDLAASSVMMADLTLNVADNKTSMAPSTVPAPITKGIRFANGFFEVRASPLAGLGSFAVRDLEYGDIVLVERPLINTAHNSLHRAFRALSREKKREYMSLYALERDGQCEIESIRQSNAFRTRQGLGVFTIASRFNHACSPVANCRFMFDESRQLMTIAVTAFSGVAAGRELLVDYGLNTMNLWLQFGFRCACGACRPISDRVCRRLMTYLNGFSEPSEQIKTAW